MSKYTDFVRIQMGKLRGESMSSAEKMKVIGQQWRQQKGGATTSMKGGSVSMRGGSTKKKKGTLGSSMVRMHGGGAGKKRRKRKQIGSAVPGGFGQYGGSVTTSLLPANEVPMKGGSVLGVMAGIGTAISLGQAIAPYAEKAVKKLSELHKNRKHR